MTGSIPPVGPLAYEGQVAVPFIARTTSPLSTNNQFPVPTIWINSAMQIAFIQVAKPLGSAVWITLGGAPGNLDTITTPDSVVVTPISNNINFLNGSAMSITGSGDNITFNSTSGGIVWNDITGVSSAMLVNEGYVADNGSLVTLTLPSVAAFGSIIEVVGKGNGGWIIAQNAGQSIIYGSGASTSGVSGSIASNKPNDCVKLLCTTANTTFTITGGQGVVTLT